VQPQQDLSRSTAGVEDELLELWSAVEQDRLNGHNGRSASPELHTSPPDAFAQDLSASGVVLGAPQRLLTQAQPSVVQQTHVQETHDSRLNTSGAIWHDHEQSPHQQTQISSNLQSSGAEERIQLLESSAAYDASKMQEGVVRSLVSVVPNSSSFMYFYMLKGKQQGKSPYSKQAAS
jgi:hypothetical protein